MDFLESRINRRVFGGVAAGTVATAGIARFVAAQDATPEADVEATPESAATLADLESAVQFDVIAQDRVYAIYQAGENVPGWYVFNLDNQSESDAAMSLARLPEGVSISDFNSFLFQLKSGETSELPEWLLDVTFAGGTYAPAGGTNSVLMHLDVGEWVVFSDLAVSGQSSTTILVSEPVAEEGEDAGATPVAEAATPVETSSAVTPPEDFGSTFTVSLADASINADSSPAAGYNIIGVRNDSSLASNFVLLHSAEGVDEAAAADLAAGYLAGEETGATLAGGMGIIGVDAYGYIELEAEAGSYVGFSSTPNTDGSSKLEGGAITVFNVG